MISAALEHAAHLLPDQAPLEMFVHHNTLHAFQERPFHEALRAAHARLGADVYRSAAAFRAELARGRIDGAELDLELDRFFAQRGLDPDARIADLCSRRELHRIALRVDLSPPTRAALRWRVREERFDRALSDMDPPKKAAALTRGQAFLAPLVSKASVEDLAHRFLGPHGVPERMGERYAIDLDREQVLAMLARDPEPLVAGATWQTCRRLARVVARRAPHQIRADAPLHRDIILAKTGEDVWRRVHPELTRWAAAYLDEGLAYWPMAGRERGLLASVAALVACSGPQIDPWLRRARHTFTILHEGGVGALDAIAEILDDLAIPDEAIDELLFSLLSATSGFAGMYSRLERHPHERSPLAPPTSLADFCALRLVYERAALEQAARDHGLGELRALSLGGDARTRREPSSHPDAALAYPLFILTQRLGLSLVEIDALDGPALGELFAALDEFDALDYGHVFQEAYERRYRGEILDGIHAVRPASPGAPAPRRPKIQVVVCIDDREESLRRHIEELDPDAETFGAAGSFGLAIDYRGLDAGGHIPLAPAGVRPRHEIVERPISGESMVSEARQSRRRRWGHVLHQVFFGSRAGLRGALASMLIGPLAWLPLSARVFAPRSSMRALEGFAEAALPKPTTRLANADDADLSPRGLACGYSLAEQVDRVHALLENMGLRRGFAPLVFLIAHGSTSLNNPHEAAHDCGACGGRRGGATARLLAIFANDPRVRAEVADRGITIPDDTWFVAGEHDTADDRVDLYDLDLVPPAWSDALADARRTLDRARALNGHERARKFEMAALSVSVDEGLRHVEGRASHLAEPRPEYGHCTNAICIVGRRSLTRGLFLDRRAFLVSYDPEADPNDAVLERLLAIAGPVGAGINLEYYFSIVDPERFGCGTKLPHNICAYLGVLNGTSGDLRTGLPLQMTEIHEPMRLLVIVEATPAALARVASRQPILAELVQNGWIQLVSVDPDTGQMQVLEDGAFVDYTPSDTPVPEAPSSPDYYAGSREFLPPAKISAGAQP